MKTIASAGVYAALGVMVAIALLSGRSHPRTHRLFIASWWVVYGQYFLWRGASILSAADLSFPTAARYVFFALELLVTYYFFALELPQWSRPTTVRGAEVEANLGRQGDAAPRIEILVPTYNEAWPVLETTLAAARAQRYPNFGIWILDDGRRDWLREKALEVGASYLMRSDSSSYKAGNLNHALLHLRAGSPALEYICVLDADCIAFPALLERTLALMTDRVAIVQTPQCYFNPDPFQRAFSGVNSWPDDMRTWYDEKQPRNDGAGRALCSGTAYLARLRALEEIGGYPIETVTEDTFCSIKLRSKGWQTRYLNERLSVGLAPHGLGEFLAQRVRWQRGWLQLVRLWRTDDSLGALFRYTKSVCRTPVIYLLELAWFGVVLAYLWSGFWVFGTPAGETILHLAPLWVGAFFASWLTRGRQTPFVVHVHRLAQSWALLRMNLEGLRNQPVEVTDKIVTRDEIVVHWGTLKWLVLLGLGLVGGALVAIRRASIAEHEPALLALNLGLAALLCCEVTAVAIPAIELPRRRRDERYPANEAVQAWADGRSYSWTCRELALGGALFHTGALQTLPQMATVELDEVGPVRARLVRRADGVLAAYSFESPEQRAALIRKIYGAQRYVPAPQGWTSLGVLLGFCRGVIEFPLRWARLRSQPHTGGTSPAGAGATRPTSGE